MLREWWAQFAFGLLLISILVLPFQNCSRWASQSESVASLGGDPYTGMAPVYRHFDSTQPCAANDTSGNPLPNDEVIFRPDNSGAIQPYLARTGCQDMNDPTQIAPGDLQISSLRAITYKSQSFTSQNPPGDFDIVEAACPAGKTPIPGAVRTNLFTYALDWTVQRSAYGSPGWYSDAGIATSLNNTIDSLPGFEIIRNDSSNLDYWRSTKQQMLLSVNTDYSFAFLARAGTVNFARSTFFRALVNSPPGQPLPPQDEAVEVIFDLQAGTATVSLAQNITNVSATIVPAGNGYFCTVYFTSSATDNQGVPVTLQVYPSEGSSSPYYQQVGDSIIATDAQLVPISQFCQ